MKKKDIDFNEHVLWVRGGKGGKDRLSILSKHLCDELLEFTKFKTEDDFVFANKNGGSLSQRSYH